MRNVNIHTFFKMDPPVPRTEHSRFWPKADRLFRQAGLDPVQRHEYITACRRRLELESEELVLMWLKEQLPAFSWKRELLDLPEFLFVYAGLILGAYEQILVPLMDGTPIQWQMPVSLGTLLQAGFVYLIYKALLWVACGSQRGAGWWFPVIGLFVLYLGAIYVAGLFASVAVVHINVVLLVGVLGVLTAIFRRRVHEFSNQ